MLRLFLSGLRHSDIGLGGNQRNIWPGYQPVIALPR